MRFPRDCDAVAFCSLFDCYAPVGGKVYVAPFASVSLPQYYLLPLGKLSEPLRGRRLLYIVNRNAIGIGVDQYTMFLTNLSRLSTYYAYYVLHMGSADYWIELWDKIVDSRIRTEVSILSRDGVERGYDKEEVLVAFTGLGENLWGALSLMYYRAQGYIVYPEGTLTPLLGIPGTPDAVIGQLGAFHEALARKGLGGLLFYELELLGVLEDKPTTKTSPPIREQLIALEFEPNNSRASGGRKQLNKYVATGYFNYGILICPGQAGSEKYYQELGYLTWDEQGNTLEYKPRVDETDPNKLSEAVDQAKILASYAILKNLKLNKLAGYNKTIVALLSENPEKLLEHI